MNTARASNQIRAIRPLIEASEVRRTLSVLLEPGQIVEVRALEAAYQREARYTETLGGYFDNIPDLIGAISKLQVAQGIYITLQPCHPDLLHRASNKLIRQKKDYSTPDKYVTGYRWLLIDSDPDRISNISSTEEEHQEALAHSRHIREELHRLGWPDPVEGDSGNGTHLLYRVDLPTSDADLVKRVLEGLAQKFDTPTIHVDKTVYNPARICKLYGTLACKGDDTSKRPHRLSHLVHVPEKREVVSRELLEATANELVVEASNKQTTTKEAKRPEQDLPDAKRPSFDLAAWIEQHQIETYGAEPYDGQGTRWVLKTCPWDSAHTDKSAYIVQLKNGAIAAGCQHNGCQGKKWQDLRLLYEPDAYDGDSCELSQAMQIVQLALDSCEPFSTPEGDLWARVLVKGHRETWRIHSDSFKRWLIYQMVKTQNTIPGANALNAAISALESQAEHGDAPRREVALRLAAHNGHLYLDLANDAREVVEITPQGWQIITDPPVCFRRPKGMLPQVRPVVGGSLAELKQFINIKEEDWILLQAWLLGTFHPTGPYAILDITGERGSAKSTTSKVLRSLVDPAKAPVRREPKDDQAFAIMAENNYLVAFDNLSHLSHRFSDNMCTLATGSGDAFRTLYTNDEETIFTACRPQLFNGIEELATRGDLIDRCLSIHLEAIPEEKRQDEHSFWQAFDAAKPRLLGALLDAVCLALRNLPHTQLSGRPRMADFALWVQAAETALTTTPGEFMESYMRNREEGVSSELEANPIGQAILDLMQQEKEWRGTASDLKKKLEEITDEQTTKQKSWPADGRSLSGKIKRLLPSLRARHIEVVIDYDTKARHRYISLKHQEESQNQASATQNSEENQGCNANATQNQKACVADSSGSQSQLTASATHATQNPANLSTLSPEQEVTSSTETPSSDVELHRCTTVWEYYGQRTHTAIATHKDQLGYWWCDRCANSQQKWMESGSLHDFAAVAFSDLGFEVPAGQSQWLMAAQDAGYELLEQALEQLQQSEAQRTTHTSETTSAAAEEWEDFEI